MSQQAQLLRGRTVRRLATVCRARDAAQGDADYWMPKLQANVARDRRNDRELEEMGWSVLRFWEHQPVEQMADRVVAIVEQLRLRDGKSQGLTGACVVAVNRRFAGLSSAVRILGAP